MFSNDNLRELSELGDEVSELLKRYAPGSGFELEFAPPTAPQIGLPPAISSLVEHGFKCPIPHAGHGLQRALILTLLNHLALAQPAAEAPKTSENAELVVPAISDPDLIIAIEEPELYLHPNRCRHLADLFMKLSKPQNGEGRVRNQILYATHSPYFVDLQRFDQVRIARRVPGPDAGPLCCTFSRFSRHDASEVLAVLSEDDPSKFTAASFQARATGIMTTMVNEGFFAQKVVVVEGASEAGALSAVARIKGHDWNASDVAIIPAIGKNNIDRPVIVFRGLGIPTYFVFDSDGDKTGKQLEEQKPKNRQLLRLGRAPEQDLPRSEATASFAVFAKTFEYEVTDNIGRETYHKLRRRVSEEFGYKETDVMKNADCTARMIELIYEQRLSVPILEEIVKYVELIPIVLCETPATSEEAAGA